MVVFIIMNFILQLINEARRGPAAAASTVTEEHPEEQDVNEDSPSNLASLEASLEMGIQVCPQTDNSVTQINGFGKHKGKTVLKFMIYSSLILDNVLI